MEWITKYQLLPVLQLPESRYESTYLGIYSCAVEVGRETKTETGIFKKPVIQGCPPEIATSLEEQRIPLTQILIKASFQKQAK